MTDHRLAVVVLAAGQGTRMRSRLPKLLHPLAGIPLVGHVLSTARALEAEHVVVVLRHERDALARVVADDLPDAIVVDQDEVPGTGRAVELALAALPDDFEGEVLVLNGDVPLLDSTTLEALLAEHRAGPASATLLSTYPDDATGYGRIVRDATGAVDRIVEHRDATDDERALGEINAGVYLFGLSGLRDHLAQLSTDNAQGEKYLTDVVGALRAAGSEVQALPVAESWIVEGINDRAQLSYAAAKLNALIVRAWQLAGVTVQDPATTWIDLKARLAEDVTLLPGTQVLGATTIERGASVGPDTTLRDCEIGEDALVSRSDATLAVIGAGATVGPFAFVRPGTRLGDRAKIGTFSETKNAVIGADTKLAHFNYVGDAEVGEGGNLGAGTITSNYDGVNKHRTVIGSHVRIGANTVFIAPVRMGDGAYTGAGAIVRKDVPAGSLAITVAPQRNMAGWVESHRPGSAAAEAARATGERDAAPEA